MDLEKFGILGVVGVIFICGVVGLVGVFGRICFCGVFGLLGFFGRICVIGIFNLRFFLEIFSLICFGWIDLFNFFFVFFLDFWIFCFWCFLDFWIFWFWCFLVFVIMIVLFYYEFFMFSCMMKIFRLCDLNVFKNFIFLVNIKRETYILLYY